MKVIKPEDMMSDQAPHDDGKVGAFLARWFGRSYRTSIAGLFATGCAIVSIAPVDPEVAKFAERLAIVIAGSGLVIAKDSRVSGKPSA